MLKALLVDDEVNNLSSLEFLLHNDCSGVQVVGKAKSVADARVFLQNNFVDVVFLDISMPNESGFELLKSIDSQGTKVVFVTAHNEYSLQAIKASAVDYLLKPVDIDELQKAVEKVQKAVNNPLVSQQSKLLLDHFVQVVQSKTPLKKIAVPQLGSIRFVDLDEIVSLQADSNYTIIHLNTMQKMVVSKTLKDFAETLNSEYFIRIHKSYIVNVKYVKEYSTIDGGVVKMADGNQWTISRRQLDSFLDLMKSTTLTFGKTK